MTIMKEINTETVSAFILTKIQLFHQSRCLELFNLPVDVTEKVWKGGGSKVWDPGQGGACNSALMDQMQGAFVGYYWVLVKSRSCDLYRGQITFRAGLASVKVTAPWLDQNSIVTHKLPVCQISLWAELLAPPCPRDRTLLPPFEFAFFSGNSIIVGTHVTKFTWRLDQFKPSWWCCIRLRYC